MTNDKNTFVEIQCAITLSRKGRPFCSLHYGRLITKPVFRMRNILGGIIVRDLPILYFVATVSDFKTADSKPPRPEPKGATSGQRQSLFPRVITKYRGRSYSRGIYPKPCVSTLGGRNQESQRKHEDEDASAELLHRECSDRSCAYLQQLPFWL